MNARYLVIAGGVLMAGGTVLPWLTLTAALVGSVGRSGLEMGGDALIVLGAGVLVALMGLVPAKDRNLPGLVAILAAVGAGFILYMDYGELAERAKGTAGTSAIISIGPGFYVSAVGVVVAIIGVIAVLRENEKPAPEGAGGVPGWKAG